MANKLRGGAGPSRVNGLATSHLLLRYGKHSQILREEIAAWVEWMSNTTPPWAAYCALQTCRLVALDKGPGVRLLGIGEIWKRGMAKCALKVGREETKAACSSTNLCAGLEALIEGALHAVSARAADAHYMEFGEWEVDDDVFTRTAEEDEVQDSLLMQRANATRGGGPEIGPGLRVLTYDTRRIRY